MDRREARVAGAVMSILVACLCLAGAIGALWVDTVLLDTDTVVAALAPLARDEGVRETMSERVSTEIIGRADLEGRARELLPEFLMPLAERLASEFERFVRDEVDSAVRSDAFADAWADGIRIWHGSFSEAVKGGDAAYLDFEDGAMRVALAPYLELVEDRVDEPVLQSVIGMLLDPVRDSRVTLIESRLLTEQIEVMRWLYGMQTALWWIAGVALLLALVLAPRRELALIGAGLGMALAGVAPAAWVLTQRSTAESVLGRLTGATPSTTRSAYETLTSPLLEWYAIAIGVGLAVAAAGWLISRRRPSGSQGLNRGDTVTHA